MSTALEHVNGIDLVAAARAEAIRREAEAAAEAERIRAEGEADAARIKAEQEAERQRIATERAARKAQREAEEHQLKVAEIRRKREATERATADERKAAQEEKQVAEQTREATEKAIRRWRSTAIAFYGLCGAVALPVQIAAFWSPSLPWLVLAPVLLEVTALVVLVGASTAVAEGRPHWHYRLIAWAAAFVAAGINFSHGLAAFDTATAVGTAIASVAGPGVWDLHEHGRIAKKVGKPTRRERRAAKKEAKRAAAEERARQEREEAKRAEAAEKEKQRAEQLAAARLASFPDVWKHALKLAAALGETTVTEAVWKKAHRDVRGAEPGEDAETIRMRNKATHQVESARSGATVTQVAKRSAKTVSQQLVPQVPHRSQKSGRRGNPAGPPVRGVRRKGDSPKQVPAARKQASITARQSVEKGADQ